jgi:hypothetical protein
MTPDARNIEYKEKLPIAAGLLISENTRQYVFRGKPESFTGGARPHEFPLGETLELASLSSSLNLKLTIFTFDMIN